MVDSGLVVAILEYLPRGKIEVFDVFKTAKYPFQFAAVRRH